jgi:DeoR family transcriptional regulator of aga operon
MQELRTLSGLERQEQIAEMIMREQRITTGVICEVFGVSEATARRDLETLDEDGRIRRVHGGAIAIHRAPPELPILQRESEQAEEKARIGHAAATLVPDGASVFLGSGTTVLEVARCLRQRSNLTIITNSLSVINALADLPGLNLIAIGGVFRPSELSFIGHLAEQIIQEMHVDIVFIGARAINLKQGLTNDYLPETLTDRAILKVGRKAVLVADRTKFGRIATAFLASLESIDTVVTDQQISEEYINELEANEISVIRV